ncbi:hypothetical protein [Dermatophilus congolensis]|uniref:hypothetical protein n=1 Tax=Dermatophilus congolensis TaxID=1863 RepID=UPI001AAF4989|nr:hypothetical protein [Dermatophilus congolensis]MBO3142770.1 hypothetical protein [Dermatophilus congolensis]MBO3151763.1 hypothetical protein [Dermatophilus congolensis]MBO3161234.1 hypothetical protein [Dermatophilus congolensis]MBO3163045.1 hypothetical protein [Dermatophilus congolensis]MBO3176598.1 hypothetical protein [Dermatophilus congolensis]
MNTTWILTTLLILALFAWHLSYTAARLHRLHTRAEGALAALDAYLIRRAEAATALANSGLLDPASSLILASASAESTHSDYSLLTLDWAEGKLALRELTETALTVALRETLPTSTPTNSNSPESDPIAHTIATHRRVQLARQFYNNTVSDVRRLRHTPLVRIAHLAGHATTPRPIEFDDDLTASPT